MGELLNYLLPRTEDGLLPWGVQKEAAAVFGRSLAEVEEIALQGGILPARYQRNRIMISLEQQRILFRSTVAVLGCGGLGGYILEGLARLGVGRIIAIDPDIFVEHNLNRQLLSAPEDLGKAKVDVALERILRVNPAVTLTPLRKAFDEDNGAGLLASADLAIDALDSIEARCALETVCRQMEIPFVLGAIAGWYGHVSTIFPGDQTVQKIFGGETAGKGIEQKLGNPSFTPALVASLEVAEACKVLLSEGQVLRNRMLTIDLREMDFERFDL